MTEQVKKERDEAFTLLPAIFQHRLNVRLPLRGFEPFANDEKSMLIVANALFNSFENSDEVRDFMHNYGTRIESLPVEFIKNSDHYATSIRIALAMHIDVESGIDIAAEKGEWLIGSHTIREHGVHFADTRTSVNLSDKDIRSYVRGRHVK